MKFSQTFLELGEIGHEAAKKHKSGVRIINKKDMNIMVFDHNVEPDFYSIADEIADNMEQLKSKKRTMVAYPSELYAVLFLRKFPTFKKKTGETTGDLRERVRNWIYDERERVYEITMYETRKNQKFQYVIIDFAFGGIFTTKTKMGRWHFPYITDAVEWMFEHSPRLSGIKIIRYSGTNPARNRAYKIMGLGIGYVIELEKDGDGYIKIDKDFTDEEILYMVNKYFNKTKGRKLYERLEYLEYDTDKIKQLVVNKLKKLEKRKRHVRRINKVVEEVVDAVAYKGRKMREKQK